MINGDTTNHGVEALLYYLAQSARQMVTFKGALRFESVHRGVDSPSHAIWALTEIQ